MIQISNYDMKDIKRHYKTAKKMYYDELISRPKNKTKNYMENYKKGNRK